MTLVTQNKASTYKYAPTRQALSKKSKEVPQPKYFYEKDGHLKIDIEHPAWIRMLEKRSRQKPDQILKVPQKIKNILSVENHKPEKKTKLKTKKKEDVSDTGEEKEKPLTEEQKKKAALIEDLAHRAYIADMEEQILKNQKIRYQNEQEFLKLKKSAGDVMETSLGKFLFLSFIEKGTIEFLTLSKKIKPAIENMVKEGDATGVMKRYDREFTNIFKGIQKAQAEDLKEWEGEG